MREKIAARAQFLTSIRQFFAQKNVLEVDTALLSPAGVTDINLRSLAVEDLGYLITSPEYAMKALLADGGGDIYQLSHVFRGDENGRKHRREFTLLEWYRLGWTHQQLIHEVSELVQTLFPKTEKFPVKISPYADLFQEYLDLDLFSADDALILQKCVAIVPESRQWQLSRDGMLDLLFTHRIEPNLGANCLQFVCEYPPSQAALARIMQNKQGNNVAARFELYIDGIELCNGFWELANAKEQRHRFELDNQERLAAGLKPMPIDEAFLSALERGLPDCAGVALGVDRLFMLAQGKNHIAEVIL